MATGTFKVPADINDGDKFKQKFPGRGPPKQSDFLRKKLSGKAGAKYFDSGDYNVAKANRKKDAIIMTGKQIPTPAALPHRKQSTSSRQVTTIGEPPKSPLQKRSPDEEKDADEIQEPFEEKEP